MVFPVVLLFAGRTVLSWVIVPRNQLASRVEDGIQQGSG
jgi:hypothetical protein